MTAGAGVPDSDCYEVPDRNPADDDRAARIYAAMCWAVTAGSPVCVLEDGSRSPVSVARAVLEQDNDVDDDAAERLAAVLPAGSVLVDVEVAGLIVEVADHVSLAWRAEFLGLTVPEIIDVAVRVHARAAEVVE